MIAAMSAVLPTMVNMHRQVHDDRRQFDGEIMEEKKFTRYDDRPEEITEMARRGIMEILTAYQGASLIGLISYERIEDSMNQSKTGPHDRVQNERKQDTTSILRSSASPFDSLLVPADVFTISRVLIDE